MPLHDWSKVEDWVREDFRFGWLVYLRNAMNAGCLPPGAHAHITRRAGLYPSEGRPEFHSAVGVRADGERVVAVVELVSADDTVRPSAVADYARKLAAAVRAGKHVVVVDVGPQDRNHAGSVYAAVGRELTTKLAHEGLRSHTVASFRAGSPGPEMYLDDYTFGQPLPAMPLFLGFDTYISLPLEETYQYAIEMIHPKSRAALTAD